ncbi:MAG: hypothetical protein ACU84J_00460 [Gammaproteobacteria bacterium]
MKKFRNWIGFCNMSCVMSIALSFHAAADYLPESMQAHGFLTQALFHSSDNNLFGQSDDGVSPGLTEIGLNLSYNVIDKLTFAAQGLYRRAGDVDRGSLRLDYGLADLTLYTFSSGRIGIRGGRIKVPYGLYNETRDVSFTHPGILLPQGIYYDRSRSLFLSSDGGAVYFDHLSDYGDISLKVNVGVPQSDRELITAILGSNTAGDVIPDRPIVAAQLNYEIHDGEYIFAVSFADLALKYRPTAQDQLDSGRIIISPLLFSAQYNGEIFSLTGEYLYQWNSILNFGNSLPDVKPITQSWYVEGGYRFLPEWQVSVRYNELYLDSSDKKGLYNLQFGLPPHLGFAKDWMLSLRYDVTPSWMVRTEYHYVNGTAWIPSADNPDRGSTRQYWSLFGLQISYRF